MHFDLTAAELFLAYWAGQASVEQVLDHPAYQIVQRHAQRFGPGITSRDVENAMHGQPSPFYGLMDLSARMSQIQTFLEIIRANEQTWTNRVCRELSALFPHEDLGVTVYPIIGYDMGIGLQEGVCMNCNQMQYLTEPNEFLCFIIHECVHVVYEREHRVQPLSTVISPAQWNSYFNLWLQNEGYAVYAPLRLRQELHCLADRDYQVLFDTNQLEQHRKAFLEIQDGLQEKTPLTRDAYLNYCFGPMRLTYRIGCELIRRIEHTYGMDAVQKEFYLDGDSFLETYQHLLAAPGEADHKHA